MKHSNRIIAFILCLVMAIGLIPAALADAVILPTVEPSDDDVQVLIERTFSGDSKKRAV